MNITISKTSRGKTQKNFGVSPGVPQAIASFKFTGTCADVDGVKIGVNKVATGLDATSCFNDNSIAPTASNVGYFCINNFAGDGKAIVFFADPQVDVVISGTSSSSVTEVASYTSAYSWGNVLSPVYQNTPSSGSTCTITECKPDYCDISKRTCTSTEICEMKSSTATCSSTGTVALYYFITATTLASLTTTPYGNCGTTSACCSSFPPSTSNTLYPHRYWRLRSDSLRGPDMPNDAGLNPGHSFWQLSEFNMYKDGIHILSTSQTSLDNPGTWPTGGFPPAETPSKVDDGDISTKYLAFYGAGTSIVLDFVTPQIFNSYSWSTAGDADFRDMISWTLFASDDMNVWTTIDTKSNQIVTQTRQVKIGPFGF